MRSEKPKAEQVAPPEQLGVDSNVAEHWVRNWWGLGYLALLGEKFNDGLKEAMGPSVVSPLANGPDLEAERQAIVLALRLKDGEELRDAG